MTPTQCLNRAIECEQRAAHVGEELAVTLRLIAVQWRYLAEYPKDDDPTPPGEAQFASALLSERA